MAQHAPFLIVEYTRVARAYASDRSRPSELRVRARERAARKRANVERR